MAKTIHTDKAPNAELEATNKIIKDSKQQAFGFRHFKNFKLKIFIALNSKKGREEPFLAYLIKIGKR